MSKKKKDHKKQSWILSGILFFIAVCSFLFMDAHGANLFVWENLWHKLGRPLCRMTLFVSVGLLAGQLIESLGWTRHLGKASWPLIRFARLPGSASTAFTSAFVSGVMANSMLYTSWKENKIDTKGLFLSNLLNASVPAYVLHMPTTMFIIISLTGKAGVLYVALTFLAALLRMFAIATVGRFIMPDCPACTYEDQGQKQSFGAVWKETWPKFRMRLKKIIVIIIPVYMAVAAVSESGFFMWVRALLATWVTTATISIEAMSLIVFSVATEFTSGFAAAGALLESGAIPVKQAVIALLIGNVVATPVRALRHQLPHYMGIYSPSLGFKLLATGQCVRVASVIFVGTGYVLVS